jgi:hypothetical protein
MPSYDNFEILRIDSQSYLRRGVITIWTVPSGKLVQLSLVKEVIVILNLRLSEH